MDNVKNYVKVLKYMKTQPNGNVNHAMIVVLNVPVLLQIAVLFVLEIFSYMEPLVSHLAHQDIGPIPQPILVMFVTKIV
jgi:hypothetical protein